MTQRLYTIFDKIADDAGPLFGAKNDDVAKRQFRNFIKESNNNPSGIKINIDEYSLVYVGDFDTTRMTLTSIDRPVVLNVMYGDKENEK